mmetsp:Transcript_236/g.776  ORF Transcript_236/g.776 Transcript_236/m.776 type:complete len:842 (+) Transcript_236:74-2599(+)
MRTLLRALVLALFLRRAQGVCTPDAALIVADPVFTRRTIVTNEAKGARCAQAADLDGDGLLDIVSASSTDNTVAWYKNLGGDAWSGKNDITYSSNGARIVDTGDVDGDGDVDVVVASYYDDAVRWIENDGTGVFTETHLITTSAVNAQGVELADLDGDGDLDVISASSGDNTVAVYLNIGVDGSFCEIKRIVDDNAFGVRTVIAVDLDGDGDNDLVSASKDDNTVAWYPNDGAASFPEKVVISNTSFGAYSLVARDIDADGDMDLFVASNGDDTVALWRNEGAGVFTKTIIYAEADFVLSVTAFDFDRDGDMDVASASYFDGIIRWYENLDGNGTTWQNHTLYVGAQGHYVSTGDLDGDGDEDLIAVTKSENRVQVFFAATSCDEGTGADAGSAACCRLGQSFNGSACVACSPGTYGIIGTDGLAECTACPATCTIPGLVVTPATCSGVTGCADASASAAACDCPDNEFKSNITDTCTACPSGQTKPPSPSRPLVSFAAETMWQGFLNTCEVDSSQAKVDPVPIIAGCGGGLLMLLLGFIAYKLIARYRQAVADSQAYGAWLETQVDNALANVNKLGFCVCFLPLSALKSAGRLPAHEELRNTGLLRMLDTYEQVIAFIEQHPTVFFSHQWLARTEPDPNDRHLNAMLRAAEALCDKEGVDSDHLYCWIDYACIPQANAVMKAQSIATIALYASVCRYFVAVCPTLQNEGDLFDVDTYQRRGWCRLEQWARLTVGGLKAMFVYNGTLNELAPPRRSLGPRCSRTATARRCLAIRQPREHAAAAQCPRIRHSRQSRLTRPAGLWASSARPARRPRPEPPGEPTRASTSRTANHTERRGRTRA